MTIQLSNLRERLIDANGLPMGGAKLYTYLNGTTTPLTTYSTPTFTPGTELSNPIEADAGGLLPQIFFPTATYTLTLTTSTDAAVWSQDNVAVDNGTAITFDNNTIQTVSGTASVFATPNVQTGTSYAVVASDKGKLITFSNSNSISVTQPAASATFPNGWFVDFQNRGTGIVTIASASNIDGSGSVILNQGQGIRLFSDGATYYSQRGKQQGLYLDSGGTLTVTANAITLSGSYSRYAIDTSSAVQNITTINNDSGSKIVVFRPSSDSFSCTFSSGGNIDITDTINLNTIEDSVTMFYDLATSKWIVINVYPAVKTAKFSHTVASGTDGGATTATAWTTRPITTTDYNGIGASLASNAVTLPAGTYYMSAVSTFYDESASTTGTKAKIRNTSDSTDVGFFETGFMSASATIAANYSISMSKTKVTITSAKTFEMQYYVAVAQATNGLGKSYSAPGTVEVYAEWIIEKIN